MTKSEANRTSEKDQRSPGGTPAGDPEPGRMLVAAIQETNILKNSIEAANLVLQRMSERSVRQEFMIAELEIKLRKQADELSSSRKTVEQLRLENAKSQSERPS